MASAFREMMRRDRQRQDLRQCRAAWLSGVSGREYREIEAGERDPDSASWRRMCEVFEWPLALLSGR
jgi:predicted transcriptional regulator